MYTLMTIIITTIILSIILIWFIWETRYWDGE